MSKLLRHGLRVYDFKLTEVLLLLILCEETLDVNCPKGEVRFEAWWKELGLESWRKFRPHWEAVVSAGVVDYNEAEGKYQLRPDTAQWSRMRGLRVPNQNLRVESELSLVAERPLSDALSELSRENALEKAVSAGSVATLNPVGSQALPGDEPGANTGQPREEGNPSPRPSPQGEGDPKAARDGRAGSWWEAVEVAMAGGIPAPPPVTDKLSDAPAEKSAAGVQVGASRAAEKSAAFEKPQLAGVSAPEDFSAGRSLTSLGLDEKPRLARAAEKSAAEIEEARLHEMEEARTWLLEIDRAKRLRAANTQAQWDELCRRNPGYVLKTLRRRLRTAETNRKDDRSPPLGDPLGYIARIALVDRMLRRPR